MKTFKFEITFKEGCDEFWESLQDKPDHGIAEMTTMLEGCLGYYGFSVPDDVEIRLTEFHYRED